MRGRTGPGDDDLTMTYRILDCGGTCFFRSMDLEVKFYMGNASTSHLTSVIRRGYSK